jgi:hypothetical protein
MKTEELEFNVFDESFIHNFKNPHLMNKLEDNSSDFILYTSDTGDVKVNVYLKNEMIWLTQKSISQLFNVNVPAISKHLKNIFE